MTPHVQAATMALTAVGHYLAAKRAIIEAGHAGEIEWQRIQAAQAITEQRFLREAAWAVLSAGMAERVVRARFPAFSASFLHFESADAILANRRLVCRDALRVFNHRGKVQAVLSIARETRRLGSDGLARALHDDALALVLGLPYLGPASGPHLLKNLGLPYAKPDRHLLRLTRSLGFISPQMLCKTVAGFLGEEIPVVDLVFWRWATMADSHGLPHPAGTSGGTQIPAALSPVVSPEHPETVP